MRCAGNAHGRHLLTVLVGVATQWQTVGVLHKTALYMVATDISTTIERGADWTVGLRLRTSQENLDLTDWSFVAYLINSAGHIFQTIPAILVATDCVSFQLTNSVTLSLPAQSAHWEIWATRSDHYKMRLVAGGATIV
jgi:hypothetical protein